MIKYAIIFLDWAKEFLDTLDDKNKKKGFIQCMEIKGCQ